jgi:hypothetical protein
MATPIERMIDASMRCGKCGGKGCDCYEVCSCGWYAEKGKPCDNPESRYCTSKVYHSPADKELHRGERVRLDPNVPWSPVNAAYARGYFGTVAATPREGSVDVSIRWDGRTSCDRIRISWLERVE